MTDYRSLALELDRLDAGARRAEQATVAARAVARATAHEDVARAAAGVRAAERAVQAAERHVSGVDTRSGRLWQELGALLGRGARHLGPLPDPAPDVFGAHEDPLEAAADAICRYALGEPIAPVPRWLVVALPPGGALAALLVALPARGLLALAGGAVDVVAQALLFLAPFAGVPVLRAWYRYRYGAHPDIGAAGLTALGGMIASCAGVFLLR